MRRSTARTARVIESSRRVASSVSSRGPDDERPSEDRNSRMSDMAKSIEKPSTFPLRAPETARARSARAPCAFRIACTHLTSLLGNQSFDSSALARTTHAERPVCLVVIWSDAVLVTGGIGFLVR